MAGTGQSAKTRRPDLVAPVRAFDRFQRRHASLAIPVAVLRNFSDQQAGNAAALMAFWGFFSLFPLLLLFVSALGFVLAGDRSEQQSVLHAMVREFPIIKSTTGRLTGSAPALGIGAVGALLSGLGVTISTQNAFNRVYTIPPSAQASYLASRWRGLKVLLAVGLLQIVSTAAAGAVSGGLGGVLVTVAGLAISLLLNLCLFFVAFRFLVARLVPTRELWPGIIAAAIGWEVVQSVGGIYIAHVVKGAGPTYGSFATVIGLLTWLYLGARIVVYAAEINVVLTRRLWPRSILAPPEPADRRARAALAKMAERDAHETIAVAFDPEDTHAPSDPAAPVDAVAPGPASRERAEPLARSLAARDPHTLTVEDLLSAIDGCVADADAPPAARAQAREWLTQAAASLAEGHGEDADPQAAATAALADATRLALGLREDPPVRSDEGTSAASH